MPMSRQSVKSGSAVVQAPAPVGYLQECKSLLVRQAERAVLGTQHSHWHHGHSVTCIFTRPHTHIFKCVCLWHVCACSTANPTSAQGRAGIF